MLHSIPIQQFHLTAHTIYPQLSSVLVAKKAFSLPILSIKFRILHKSLEMLAQTIPFRF